MRSLIALMGLIVCVQACSARGTAISAPGTTAATTARRMNVITRPEMQEVRNAVTAADVVRQLRPGWPSNVTVFLDNQEYGDLNSLRNIGAASAIEIRYLTISEAQMKWGSRYREVIQVITK